MSRIEKSDLDVRSRSPASERANSIARKFQFAVPELSVAFSLSTAMLIISSLYVPIFRFSSSATLSFSRYIALINVKKVYDDLLRKSRMYNLAVVLNLPQLHKSMFLLLKKYNCLNLLTFLRITAY